MRTKKLLVLLVIAAVLSLAWSPTQLAAHTIPPIQQTSTSTIPMLPGTTRPLSTAEGNQTNPHVACNVASYTNDSFQGTSSIMYFDFASNSEFFVVAGTGQDRLSDTDGRQVALTSIWFTGDVIFIYDLVNQTTLNIPGAKNSDPAIAANQVAFVHSNSFTSSDIAVFDETTLTTTPLTNDGLLNRDPAISPDGKVVVWEKCQADGTGCDIYSATKTGPGAFTTRLLTGAGEDRYADTDGQLVTYISDKNGDRDIYIQRLDTGTEKRIALSGDEYDARISKNLIVFESKPGPSYDVFLYDLSTARLFRVTNTDDRDESLSDIFTGCDGVNRIVFVRPGTFGDADVWETEFQIPDSTAAQLNDLMGLVQSFDLHDGIESSLTSKLQDALTAVNNADTGTACDSLTAFVNATRAQSGKKLTIDQANQLIDGATEIKSDLGCQ
jgi:hypothetical protein